MITATPSLRQPSAFLPVALSLGAVAVVIAQLLLVGSAPQPDEGTAAHVWQLLMAVQVPIIAYFAIRYLPRNPRSTALILALQVLAIIVACAPVLLLHW